MGQRLGQVFRSAVRLEPVGSGQMPATSLTARELVIGNVLGQCVAELKLRIAMDRAPSDAMHELLSLQVVQELLGLPGGALGEGVDRADPGGPAYHGGVLKEPSLVG